MGYADSIFLLLEYFEPKEIEAQRGACFFWAVETALKDFVYM